MQILSQPGDQPSYEHPDQYFHLRIPWKNHGFCKKQPLSQNYNCPFPQCGKMGWFLTFRYVKTLCYWDYLFRSSSHRKTCFLYCWRYDSFKDKAFVTGSASDWRCVFSSVSFKVKTGLRASGSCGYAFLQRHCFELSYWIFGCWYYCNRKKDKISAQKLYLN